MNILVVDDHPLVLDALQQIVKRLDRSVAVLTARSRTECLARLEQASPAGGEGRAMRFLLSCGLAVLPSEIPGRLSSSSLPPSFAPGRRTTVFTATGTAERGARRGGGRP